MDIVERLRERAWEVSLHEPDMRWAWGIVSDTAPGGFTTSRKLVDPLLEEAAEEIERLRKDVAWHEAETNRLKVVALTTRQETLRRRDQTQP